MGRCVDMDPRWYEMSAVPRPTAKIPKLMAHQKASIEHAKKNPIVFDTSDAGTGKTRVRIEVFAARRRKGGGCLLVVCSRSLLYSAWAADFIKFAPDMRVSVATAANREAAFAKDADAYVTNHDATKWLVKQPKAFFAKFSEIVIDESTAFKHHTSQRSKALARILHNLAPKAFVYRSALTATPNSNGICDVWHQAYLLDGGKRLGPSFYGFRNSVCVPHQVGRNKNAIDWIDKDGAEEAVFAQLADIVIRHKRDECIDLPANHIYARGYELSPAQQKAYDTLQDTQLLLLTQDRVTARLKGASPKITAINAAAVATKLIQVASGAVYESPEKYRIVDTSRYEMVLDLVEEVDHSLVLYQWKHQRDLLIEEAKKRKLTYCVFDGETSDKRREELVREYQAGFYRVMIAHPKTVGHGLTLTRGTRTVWASPTYDLELWVQASSRQHRIGQTEKTETIVVLAKDTIEEKVYDLMLAKDARMTSLLELFATL